MSIASGKRRHQRGFTLVETLVSLAMLTLGLVALIQIFGTGFRGIRASDLDAAALHLASSQLARAGTETPLKAGQQQGTTPEGLEWTIALEPYIPPGPEAESAARRGGLEAYWITSTVRWKSSLFAPVQQLELRTLKVAAP
jgi:prepilin-type N-terminal cleavage/methylation domain-containing protein